MPTYLIDDSGALMGPVELPVVPGLGEQTPSNAVSINEVLNEPNTGFAWTLVDGELRQVIDLRCSMYRITDGSVEEWNGLGLPPERLTAKQWPGKYYVWREGDWALDTEAQKIALASAALILRDQHLREAATRIAPLQYAKDLGDATEAENASLLEWKRYSVELNRIEQHPDYPFQIKWPSPPSDAAPL
ncbi:MULTISPECIES: tail fiber assembly protein [Pseudomonas syringae group]|uniref:Phage tail protein n=1 Tax=Pseudomonas coronafaciens pv. coronafaciens TaxID=235275 RepID=A0AAE6QLM0_9PSED|nr:MULTISPECIES: tail fiber assembly protein [Pseudomonas syringae group]MCF5712243.1 phage tail protein [Pseudomonas tremae]MCF5746456.1 phage tail protein [Pseudomonas tremae]MCF5803286.1 phage tail protein [Pseudomonas tremae]MCF5807229.1 phage tail protein [Pseudomonas tremae]QGT83928.1 phage tail protein [Pseudomonas coronafaciens pv. coronafaciens]